VRRNIRRVSPHASRDEVTRRRADVRRCGDRAYLLVQGLRDLVTVAITEQPTRAYSLYVSPAKAPDGWRREERHCARRVDR